LKRCDSLSMVYTVEVIISNNYKYNIIILCICMCMCSTHKISNIKNYYKYLILYLPLTAFNNFFIYITRCLSFNR
jgi:hypothetical protein